MLILSNSKEHQSTIARFDPIENSWTKLGNLNMTRSGHGVIQVNNEFIVVGGVDGFAGSELTESCKLNRTMICTKREPELSKLRYYPELTLV